MAIDMQGTIGMNDPVQKKANARLGWILASVVLVFFLGFIARIVLLES